MNPLLLAALIALAPFKPTLTLTPRKASVPPGGTLSLSAAINYEPDGPRYPRQPVKWSVVEGEAGGSVTMNGVYTAPTTPGTYHVRVVREDFPKVSRQAVIRVR